MAIGTGLLSDIKTVGALLRISDEKKDSQGKRVSEEETLKNHKDKITEFVNEHNMKVTFFEEVISGGSQLAKRPALENLLNNIENFDAIVVMELARLSRSGTTSQLIKDKVIQYRKLIIQLNPFQIFDIANKAMDGMFYDFSSGMNEYERRVIGARIKENKLIMSRAGLNASGSVPLGYVRNKQTKKLEIDETKAPIVREAFRLYQEGLGFNRIAEELNNAGYTGKTGNRFGRNTLKTMLTCETYKGFIVYHNVIKNGTKKEIIDTIRIPEAHPAIIDPEVFDALQQVRENRAERFGQINSREKDNVFPSILKDLLFCPVCGRKIRIAYEAKRKNHHIRKCYDWKLSNKPCENTGMLAEVVEKKVLQLVFKKKEEVEAKINELKSDDFTNYQEALEQQIADQEKQKKKLEIEFNVIRKAEKVYLMEKEESGFADELEEEAIAQDKQQNKEARIKVQQKLKEINEKLANVGSPEKEVKKLQEVINVIDEIKKNPSPEKMNMLLKRIIHKIYYDHVLPPEIASLGTKHPDRLKYPAKIKIEYVE
ncbi:MAG TPA: recombinase family protein [Candidatus Saccharimonadales bacterium]|nr:recombinase family protein [Candidatus Saccharimonadales bacterium]